MYGLKSIIEQNKKAEELGIMKPGEAVGTTGYIPGESAVNKGWEVGGTPVKGHAADQGGLRGHSIGESYPFSVVAGDVTEDGRTTWTVINYATSETFNSYRGVKGSGACARAHAEAMARKRGVFIPVAGATYNVINPEY